MAIPQAWEWLLVRPMLMLGIGALTMFLVLYVFWVFGHFSSEAERNDWRAFTLFFGGLVASILIAMTVMDFL